MAVPTLALPQFAVQDGRGFFWAGDVNNGVFVWPNVNNGATAQTFGGYTGAAATHTVTVGPEVGAVPSGGAFNTIQITYNGVSIWISPNTPTVLPDPYERALISGSMYTVT